MTVPVCTYRVQLHGGFGFRDAARLADYLAALGVSQVYCSPYLQAVAGSTHGYDVVDPQQLDAALGGAAGYADMVGALHDAGLGQVLDIVPNHMAVDPSNRWWWDVLENGPASRYARYFDIDWAGPDEKAAFTVLVPVLGDHYGRVLEAGELKLEQRDDAVVVRYYDHVLPISPRSIADLVADGTDDELAAINDDVDRLDAVLQHQHYRLAHWRTASEELDYRRFFNIESLVGVRVEDPEVFAATHELILSLVRDGAVDGLRVDHVDGLRDPKGYVQRLAEYTGGAYTVVEKILAPDERLPESWPVAGTSGYDFLSRVNNAFVAVGNELAMSDCYIKFTGETASYDELVHSAKHQIMREELATEVERATALLAEVSSRHRRHRDHTRRELREALREFVAAFPVYRTYVQPGQVPTTQERTHITEAVAGATANRPDIDAELVELLGQLALGDYFGAAELEFTQRLQQLTAPVMAKGVEDTAFYRYNRLISLNEVGGNPGVFGRPLEAFHRDTEALAGTWPQSMLTLSTHDTKRSADVRARLSVLSEIPDAWGPAVERWAERNERHRRGEWPDRNTEYLLYQTLVGAWPLDAERALAFMAKATREAKTHTSWTDPVAEYDDGIESFTRAILGDEAFVEDLVGFIGEHHVVERGRRNSLAQTTLLLTCPGVPDLYQGSELWDLSLVDPDNRRPVDYDMRRQLLTETRGRVAADVMQHVEDGTPKLWLIERLLAHRRSSPDAYASANYEPIEAHGERGDDVIGFVRDELAVVVPRLGVGSWGDTTASIPSGRWSNVLTGAQVNDGAVALDELFGVFPVVVLAQESS